jgi:hypothetical protein
MEINIILILHLQKILHYMLSGQRINEMDLVDDEVDEVLLIKQIQPKKKKLMKILKK